MTNQDLAFLENAGTRFYDNELKFSVAGCYFPSADNKNFWTLDEVRGLEKKIQKTDWRLPTMTDIRKIRNIGNFFEVDLFRTLCEIGIKPIKIELNNRAMIAGFKFWVKSKDEICLFECREKIDSEKHYLDSYVRLHKTNFDGPGTVILFKKL